MPTRTQIILCWALFTATMAMLSVVFRATILPAIGALQDAVGVGAVGIVMLAAWCAAAYFGWGPSVRAAIARRRGATVRQR